MEGGGRGGGGTAPRVRTPAGKRARKDCKMAIPNSVPRMHNLLNLQFAVSNVRMDGRGAPWEPGAPWPSARWEGRPAAARPRPAARTAPGPGGPTPTAPRRRPVGRRDRRPVSPRAAAAGRSPRPSAPRPPSRRAPARSTPRARRSGPPLARVAVRARRVVRGFVALPVEAAHSALQRSNRRWASTWRSDRRSPAATGSIASATRRTLVPRIRSAHICRGLPSGRAGGAGAVPARPRCASRAPKNAPPPQRFDARDGAAEAASDATLAPTRCRATRPDDRGERRPAAQGPGRGGASLSRPAAGELPRPAWDPPPLSGAPLRDAPRIASTARPPPWRAQGAQVAPARPRP